MRISGRKRIAGSHRELTASVRLPALFPPHHPWRAVIMMTTDPANCARENILSYAVTREELMADFKDAWDGPRFRARMD